MLKTRDYDLWSMRMEQYLSHTDYALYEVIINGDSLVPDPLAVGTVVPLKTEAQKLARKNKLKAKSTLLLAIHDEHLLKFHSVMDAKSLWEAIKTSINEAVNTAQDIHAAGSKEQPSASSYVDDINTDDLEEMDLKWQTRVECYNYHRRGHFARECHASRNQGNRSGDNERKIIPIETPASALVVQDGLGGYDWSYQAEEGPTNFALMAHSSDSANSSNYEVQSCSNECASDSSVSEIDEDNNQAKYRNFVLTTVAIKSGQVLVNAAKQTSAASTSTAKPKVNTAAIRANVNSKSSYFKPHSTKRRHFNQKLAVKTNTFSRKNNTAKGKNVTTVRPKALLNAAEGKKENVVKSPACWIWRQKGKLIDHTSKDSGSYTLKRFNYVDPNGRLTSDQGIFDSGCSMHITGNKSFLTEYQEIDGGFVAFEGSPKGGQITRKGDLTCLFTKATIDESNLWHKRLGHINFKTLNKLGRGNLVRGLLSKNFENDHSCVARKKGKQHKATCKTKLVSSISQPLQILHMDLFGPTFVKSLNKTMYCLVITDDFSSKMNKFCQMKGIKREFSVARTPQQNGVAEKKNRTLIEAARTMLADFLLPTIFWAEAVNIACYVQNRVLENFDGKADEGFLVGYSLNSKAFRVFNSRTRKVEENLHVNFLENKPLVAGSRPEWLIDIDSLTKSMNYEPVTTRNKSNDNAGDVDKISRNDDVCQGNEIRIDSNTQVVNVASSSINTASNIIDASSLNINTIDSNHTNMPTLEATSIFYGAFDDRDLGVEADTNNLDSFIVSAFLYGKIEEKVYVCQPPGFEDPDFSDKVYKVKKALYGLYQAPRACDIILVQVYDDDIIFGSTQEEMGDAFEILMHEKFQMSSMGELTFFLGLQVKQKQDGIFISQDKYVVEILKKFGFSKVKIVSTPMETSKPLLKDQDGQEVDVHMYRSMISSLMYLISSRPDIMFAVCACARHQASPKVSYLDVVKRIFRYLKGQPKLDLYPGSVKSRQWLQTPQLRLSMLLLQVVVGRVNAVLYRKLCFACIGFQTTPQMVINSPCLANKKELASPGQTTTGKDFLNPLMDGSFSKTTNAN
nr:uncharacterized mitochondrial protein AtMg00810-like [Tanacetum cinerariifolium]